LRFVDFSKAQRVLSKTLIDFRFECIGSEQTDDEIIIGVCSLARDSIYAIARYMPSPVRLSVCLAVHHTGGSVKDG